MSDQTKNRLVYEKFARAWVAKDIGSLMKLLTEDITFAASVGPEPGQTYRGRAAVRQGFLDVFAYNDALAVHPGKVTFAGERLFAEWAYDTRDPNGKSQVTRGIDIFEFRNGQISLKDAFRKTPAVPQQQSALPAPRPFSPEVYAPRRIDSLGIWTHSGVIFKAYGIRAVVRENGPLICSALVDAAREHLPNRLDHANLRAPHSGLGYVILHAGVEANWLLINCWLSGDISGRWLSAASVSAPYVFSTVGGPLSACVWETLLAHEMDAWARHMLKDEPDRSGYLADLLGEGLY